MTVETQPETDRSDLRGAQEREARLNQLLRARWEREAGRGPAPASPTEGQDLRAAQGVVGRPSFAQQRMWFLHLLEPDSPAYTITSTVTVSGELDLDRLQGAVRGLVLRHPMLRAAFVPDDESWVRRDIRSADAIPPAMSVHDTEEEARACLDAPFDLAAPPLVRVAVAPAADQRGAWVVGIAAHHIAADGWSLGIMHRDLSALYAGRDVADVEEGPAALDAATAREHAWVRSEHGRAAVDYWRTQLAGLPATEVPLAGARPAVARFRGRVTSRDLSADLARSAEELAREHGCSLYMLLLSTVALVLHRYSGQTDLAIGSPVANRSDAETAGMVGLFANTVVMRCDLSEDPSFEDVLRRARATTLDALERQGVPFELVVDAVRPERTLSQNPLFQVMLGHQNFNGGSLELEGTETRRHRSEHDVARVDLEFTTWRDGPDDDLRVRVNVADDLFPAGAEDLLMDEFERLLRRVVRQPGSSLTDLVADEGSGRLTAPAVGTDRGDLWSWFAGTAARRSHAPAVSDRAGQLSFHELHERALRVCGHLQEQGVGPGDHVGVALPRGCDSVAATLGVLAAGAAFVPINPEDPAERVRGLLEDAGIDCVLRDVDAHRGGPLGTPVPMDGDATAYIIYTSGTTGRPKGVEVRHRNVINTLVGCQQVFALDSNDRGAVLASPTFDVYYYELLSVVLAGGSTRVVTKDEIFGPEIARILTSVTRFQAVPGLMEHLLTSLDLAGVATLPDLRQAITGGDVVPPELFARLERAFPRARITVTYGPTEASIFATYADVHAGEDDYPIGLPLPGVEVLVMNDAGAEVPAGVVGELWIGGRGVAKGYVDRPEETCERYVTYGERRFYRSGDRAVLDAVRGRLEFRGRNDSQVKVRGLRIELSEVESVLSRVDGVRHGVVSRLGDGASDGRLVAHAVLAPQAHASTEREREHVDTWSQLFDRTHQDARGEGDRDFTGWNSSFDHQPIPPEHMDEWVEDALVRIRRSLHSTAAGRPKVLELGVGTGLLALELAPECSTYVGLDFSEEALASCRDLADRAELDNLVLECRDAADLHGLDTDFDVVVLNSVSQYLPSAEYLENVLRGALEQLSPAGTLFVGDVRNLALMPALHAAVLDARGVELTPATLAASCLTEQELLLDPSWFLDRFPGALVEPKAGVHDNELTRYRFDVTIPGTPPAPRELDWVEWAAVASGHEDAEEVVGRLCAQGRDLVGVTGVPHELLARDVELLASVGRGQAGTGRLPQATPAIIAQCAAGLGFHALCSTAAGRGDGGFDVLLSAGTRESSQAHGVVWPVPDEKPATAATRPTRARDRASEALRIRSELASVLPGYMVPDAVVVLDAMPLSANGKVDRTQLPMPTGRTDGRPPADGTESLVAAVWEKVLGQPVLGATDDFFGVGGTSLTAIRVTVELRRRGHECSPQQLFEHPTLEEFATFLDAKTAGARVDGTGSGSGIVGPERPIAAWEPADLAIDEWTAARKVLLTGGTGFLGSHVLRHSLVNYPAMRVAALVRAEDDRRAHERLWRTYCSYHGDTEVTRAEFDARVLGFAGDLAAPAAGLDVDQRRAVGDGLDAVVHAAADVRHVAPREEVFAANLGGTVAVAELAEAAGARLVHVSTIGVAGRAVTADAVAFTEAHLDVGQRSTEDYSASKLAAERHLRASASFDERTSVVRVGTVAPHSTSGRFQDNVDEHFWSRYLRGVVGLRMAPDWAGREFHPVPVDVMAAMIMSLTASPSARGATFHVTTPYGVSHARVAGVLQRVGYDVSLLGVDDFMQRAASALGDATSEPDDVTRVHPWLSRPADAAVPLDCTATDRRLEALRLEHRALDDDYVERFVRHCISVGYLPAPPGGAS